MMRPGSRSCWACCPSTATAPKTRSRWRSRPPAGCSWPACAPPAARSTRSTRWRWPATGTGTASRAASPTTATQSCWPACCAPTRTPTGRCPPTPSSPRPSRCWPAPSKTPSGPAPPATTSSAPTCAAAAKLTPAQLRGLLRKAGRKRGIDAEAARLREAFTAEQMRQLPLVEQAMGRQAIALLGQLDAACAAADDLEQATIESFNQHPDAEIITSFPGLGPLTGARVLAETGDDRSRFADAKGLKAYAGAAPITRASGKTRAVVHRRVKNQRLAAAGYIWAFAALTASPGARAHYDRRKKDGDRHAAAQRNLFGRLLGCLHHCLATGQHYDEHAAFPAAAPRQQAAAA